MACSSDTTDIWSRGLTFCVFITLMITLKLSSVNRVLEHAVFKLFEHKGYSLVLKFYLYDVIRLIIF